MHVVLVHVHVKPSSVQEFIEATMENARNSIQEPGIVRFDFLQQFDDPTMFTLVEIYKSETDQGKHRETNHYQAWREQVIDMMAENRFGVIYTNLFPKDENWE
jgi:(4S)-4-hydroxy-5-phosphonooxypentane-2,3-dione isomerase